MALKLKHYLAGHKANVILTRETNDSLASSKSEDMRKRVEIIRKSNPDIVISIHMNKFSQSKYFGTNFLHGWKRGGQETGSLYTKQAAGKSDEGNRRQIKAAKNLLILKADKAPSVIVECGFLSNPEEESLLITDEYQEKIAWSIFCGIIDYFANEEALHWDSIETTEFI